MKNEKRRREVGSGKTEEEGGEERRGEERVSTKNGRDEYQNQHDVLLSRGK
jgi:hypothetical protein